MTNPSTELARTVVTALRGAACARSCSRPARATRRCRSRCTTPRTAGALRLHTRIDERTAGFLALGLAKVGDRPAAVSAPPARPWPTCCPRWSRRRTPACPLVVVTADRPARLRGTGANQTTDQVGHLRLLRPDARRRRRRPRRAARLRPQHGGHRRPVHLNVQLDDPLLPDDAGWDGRRRGPAVVAGHACRLPWSDSSSSSGPRTVVVAGDDAGPPARVLAEKAGWPLLAEPSSGCRTGDSVVRTYRLLLDRRAGAQVERVVVHGHPTLSRPVSRLLARDDVEVVSVRHRGRCGRSARSPWPARWTRSTSRGPDDPAWLDAWRDADRATSRGARPVPRRRARPHAVRGGRGGQSRPAGRAGCCSSAPPTRSATST